MNQIRLLIGISIVLVLGFIGLYLWSFREYGLSPKSQDWGGFGEFINLAVGIGNVTISAFISIVLLRLEREFRQIEHQPILSFTVIQVKTPNNDLINRWAAHNVGKGAALNIVIAYNGDGNSWVNPRRCYSLEPGGKVVISWVDGPGRLLAIYSDIFPDSIYTSVCVGDVTTFSSDSRRALGNGHWMLLTEENAERLPN